MRGTTGLRIGSLDASSEGARYVRLGYYQPTYAIGSSTAYNIIDHSYKDLQRPMMHAQFGRTAGENNPGSNLRVYDFMVT